MFPSGNRPATVDAKGRLKVPAAFLEALEEFGAQVFVTSLDGKSASIYPMAVWEEIAGRVRALGELHPTWLRFSRFTNSWGHEAELDAQARILLPRNLRTRANIAGRVDVLGMERHLEVWNHETLFANISADPLTDEDLTRVYSEGS